MTQVAVSCPGAQSWEMEGDRAGSKPRSVLDATPPASLENSDQTSTSKTKTNKKTPQLSIYVHFCPLQRHYSPSFFFCFKLKL